MTAPAKMGPTGTHRLNYGGFCACYGHLRSGSDDHRGLLALGRALKGRSRSSLVSILSNFVAAFVGRAAKITDAYGGPPLRCRPVDLLCLLLRPNNSFSFLYLIHAALAAVTFHRLTWLVEDWRSRLWAPFGGITHGDHHHHGPEEMRMHVRGMGRVRSGRGFHRLLHWTDSRLVGGSAFGFERA